MATSVVNVEGDVTNNNYGSTATASSSSSSSNINNMSDAQHRSLLYRYPPDALAAVFFGVGMILSTSVLATSATASYGDARLWYAPSISNSNSVKDSKVNPGGVNTVTFRLLCLDMEINCGHSNAGPGGTHEGNEGGGENHQHDHAITTTISDLVKPKSREGAVYAAFSPVKTARGRLIYLLKNSACQPL